MLVLFISTYNEFVTIGLLKNGNLVSKIEELSNNGHSTILVPSIEKILNDNGYDTSNLNEIIVVNGPGSFTGVRLGVTVAKTLAYTLNIPIKTITSIEAIASGIPYQDKIITINDSKGKYIGKFLSNKLEEIIYLKEEDAITYLKEQNMEVYNNNSLDLESIYNYSRSLVNTPAHAVKAIYIKSIEALNGR